MPLPRLSRHLRPWHPLGSAYTVRCASRKALTTPPATNGDESGAKDSETPSSDAHDTVPVAEKTQGWLDATLAHLPIFGPRRVAVSPSLRPVKDTVGQDREAVLKPERAPATETGSQENQQYGSAAQEAVMVGQYSSNIHMASQDFMKASKTADKTTQSSDKASNSVETTRKTLSTACSPGRPQRINEQVPAGFSRSGTRTAHPKNAKKNTSTRQQYKQDLQQEKTLRSVPISYNIKPSKHRLPTHVYVPRRVLYNTWHSFRLYDTELAKQAESQLPALFGKSISHSKHLWREPLQDPYRKALATTWNNFRHSRRELGLAIKPLWPLLFRHRSSHAQHVSFATPNHPTSPSKQARVEIAATRSQSELPSISDTGDRMLPAQNDKRSLLEELFPEATNASPSTSPVGRKRDEYPKLQPPAAPQPNRTPQKILSEKEIAQKKREEVVNSFRRNMEDISVLQLAYCSTELTEVDFLRLIPKSKHIQNWRRAGEFFKIIPGRDPLSLERMPFYYLLFKSSEAALEYQNQASRLHKLCRSYQSVGMLSAVLPPNGFLEDGEDLNQAIQSYNLAPPQHPLYLSMVMQPYGAALRALIERGGYQPIAPGVDEHGQRIWKVLMHIQGWEPSPLDLFKIFHDDAWRQGMPLSFRTESMGSIHRLRDLINLRTKYKPVASVGARAAYSPERRAGSDAARKEVQFEDPAIQYVMGGEASGEDEERSAKELNQYVMNRVYNRWIIDFDDEVAATRFATHWHRRVLPTDFRSRGQWEDTEEERMCDTQVLW